MYILLFFWIFLILLGLFIRKSEVLVLVQALFISMMIALNNGNPDQWQYINLYSQLKTDPTTIFSSNIGLNILFYISSIFHQYNVSIFFISCLFMFFLYRAIIYYTNDISYVFSLYLISPFVIDTIQIKNLYATVIWLFFSRYLYEYCLTHSKNDLLKYFMGVILATSIHFAFLFTGLFALIALINKKNLFKFIFSFGIVFAVLAFMVSKIQSIVSILASTGISTFVLLASKFQIYGANYKLESAAARQTVTLLFYALIFTVFLIIRLFMKRDNTLLPEQLFNLIVLITLMSIIIVPLMTYSQEIYRIQRNLLLLYYVMFGKCLNYDILNFSRMKLDIGRLSIFICSILVALFYLYFDSLYWNYDSGFKILFKMLTN